MIGADCFGVTLRLESEDPDFEAFVARNYRPFAASPAPRPDVRVVVIGRDDTRAREAAHCLRRGGYRNIAVLEGGIEACRAAGMPIYQGMGTYEKAFGSSLLSLVEEQDGLNYKSGGL